jgi:sulfatase modifying factor 1
MVNKMRPYTTLAHVIVGTLWLGGCAQLAGLTEDYYERTDSGGGGEADASADGPLAETSTDTGTDRDAGFGEIAVVGEDCLPANALACAGNAQKLVLFCDPGTGTWTALQACPGHQLCDSLPGPNQGTCQDPVAACVGLTPGATVCEGTLQITCGPDLVTSTQVQCEHACENGACTGTCQPGSRSCSGDTPRVCRTNGTWQEEAPCAYVCTGQGACTGECKPGEKQCDGKTPQACNGSGTWESGSACPHGCEAGACKADPCAGVTCTPPSPSCVNSSTLRTCTSSVCVNGACQPTCTDTTCSHGCSGGTCTQPCGSCGPLEQCYQNSYCVAKLVSVSGGYSIDATEVTRSQYKSWLDTSPSTSGQPTYCSWNTSYTPSKDWPPGTKGSHPVVGVDWCDAYAYCQGVGKRLCGKIGGSSNGYNDTNKATSSQWYAACTSGGSNTYPYGSSYQSSTCNGEDAGHGGTVAVGSKGGCQSSAIGYAGVYDLSGNVWEWEDSCNGNTGSSDYCRLRGGSFYYNDNNLRCDSGSNFDVDRDYQSDRIGFRCCSVSNSQRELVPS